MKIQRNDYAETWYLEVNDHCFVEPVNDWRDIIALFQAKYNWYNFHLIRVELMADSVAPGYEFTCIFLGLGFRLRYNKDWADSQIQKALDEAKQAEEEGRLIPWEGDAN